MAVVMPFSTDSLTPPCHGNSWCWSLNNWTGDSKKSNSCLPLAAVRAATCHLSALPSSALPRPSPSPELESDVQHKFITDPSSDWKFAALPSINVFRQEQVPVSSPVMHQPARNFIAVRPAPQHSKCWVQLIYGAPSEMRVLMSPLATVTLRKRSV